jgi:uncharacterized membrane protein
VAVYAFDLMMCAVAYVVLQMHIIRLHGRDSVLAAAVGSDRKGKISLTAYVLAIPMALFGYAWLAGVLLIAVALIWFIPDRRIEKLMAP